MRSSQPDGSTRGYLTNPLPVPVAIAAKLIHSRNNVVMNYPGSDICSSVPSFAAGAPDERPILAPQES